jgi:hemerythrin-like domain-containing protein
MKEIIAILLNDHKQIFEKITDIKRLMTLPPEESFHQLAANLTFFQDFTFNGHHLRENEILYAWMGKQNANADTSIMDRIKHEHEQLEQRSNTLLSSLHNAIKKTPDATNTAILSDLNDLIVLYLEHMEKEEKFIFMIAEGLKLTKAEEAIMLNKMKKTLSEVF